jgi:acetylglutamate kinase
VTNPTVLKLGGELLEDPPALRRAAASIVHAARRMPLVVVHGGGRAIDAELKARGLSPKSVDGLRITDAATLDVVVSVLAGRANTALVAAIAAAGGRAVGLTGADGQNGLSTRAEKIQTASGASVDLGLVGQPAGSDAALLADLVAFGYVPVVCSIGVNADGDLLNVNADTFAAHLAAMMHAHALVIAGTTAGVLDDAGRTIEALGDAEIDAMTAAGTAHSGMLAKLAACRHALAAGVAEVSIVSGRAGVDFFAAPGTRIVPEPRPVASEARTAHL